jgi:hypothetical protein
MRAKTPPTPATVRSRLRAISSELVRLSHAFDQAPMRDLQVTAKSLLVHAERDPAALTIQDLRLRENYR